MFSDGFLWNIGTVEFYNISVELYLKLYGHYYKV